MLVKPKPMNSSNYYNIPRILSMSSVSLDTVLLDSPMI
jgi:hypothetical protein